MNDRGLTIEEVLRYIDNAPSTMEAFKRIGRLALDYRDIYEEAYNNFCNVYQRKNLNGVDERDDNAIKGKALENLVRVLFQSTGNYFYTYGNIRNGSNEMDLFLRYSDKAIRIEQVLNSKYANIVCECKNYKNPISVTYVGKFYSLIQSTHKSFGIMFSHDGFTGSNWGGAVGLAKKLFLLKEKNEEKIYIIDFNIKDFKKILEDKSIFEILDDKCVELELGITDIKKYICAHPNENKSIIEGYEE